MNHISNITINGEKYAIAGLTGSGAPTITTEGAVSQLYMDTDTGDLYKCTAASNGVYTWVKVEGGGSAEGAVLYTEQNLTPKQQAQAQANIGITNRVKSVNGVAPDVHGNVEMEVDLSNYYTKDEVDDKIEQAAGTVEQYLVEMDFPSKAYVYEEAESVANNVVSREIGDISTALDSIIAMQIELIGERLPEGYHASTTFASEYVADKAFDNDPATRWASSAEEDQWICAIFGSEVMIDSVEIYEFMGRINSFDIQYLDASKQWKTCASWSKTEDLGVDTVHQLSFTPVSTTGMRMFIHDAPGWASIYEFKMFYDGVQVEGGGTNE